MNPAELNLNPISQIDPLVIVAIIGIITLTYFALRRVYVLPYLRVMNEREELFLTADTQTAAAEDVVRNADYDAERVLSEAAAAAEQLRADARERAETYRRAKVDDATRAASERLEAGRAAIATARDGEMGRLREEAVDCVSVACERLLGRYDAETVESTVDRMIARRAQ